MSEVVKLEGSQAVFTTEQGTISGELEIQVSEDKTGQVRYFETEDWYQIGNENDDTPKTWESVEELKSAIESSAGKDAAGNTIAFEA